MLFYFSFPEKAQLITYVKDVENVLLEDIVEYCIRNTENKQRKTLLQTAMNSMNVLIQTENMNTGRTND